MADRSDYAVTSRRRLERQATRLCPHESGLRRGRRDADRWFRREDEQGVAAGSGEAGVGDAGLSEEKFELGGGFLIDNKVSGMSGLGGDFTDEVGGVAVGRAGRRSQ